MVNHVHVLIYPEARLSRIAKAIENYSARQANAMFAHHWAHGLAVLARRIVRSLVRRPQELVDIVRYIEQNPAVAGSGEQRRRLAVVERVRRGRRTGQETGQETCPNYGASRNTGAAVGFSPRPDGELKFAAAR
jgi:hypothetical protein